MDALLQSASLPGSRHETPLAIKLQELKVQFDAANANPVLALDGVSLVISPGEFVSIVGPSGCGKTTILNLLAGLLSARPVGEVSVLGKSPFAGNPDIAYMLARDSLLPWRTTLGNAAYGMELRNVARMEREERAVGFLRRVGLGEFVHRYPRALSHGMRQRCALARTFALDSQILLMDEPFGALDAQTKLQLEDLLLELWSAEQRTVLFVTHDLAEAVALSDRVIVLSPRPGRIVAEVAIDLPRPRGVRGLHNHSHFHRLCARLWGLLEQETKGHGS
ncbi:ABC transporter ATP-binding protein [Bradyrhizobium sp. McL0616]|uniref:ABC transporter ATP-binding protein n=1 Tax=Bradyrhizobium sp. McL0616 TaxID=3415674 RepID=UPI003CF40B25